MQKSRMNAIIVIVLIASLLAGPAVFGQCRRSAGATSDSAGRWVISRLGLAENVLEAVQGDVLPGTWEGGIPLLDWVELAMQIEDVYAALSDDDTEQAFCILGVVSTDLLLSAALVKMGWIGMKGVVGIAGWLADFTMQSFFRVWHDRSLEAQEEHYLFVRRYGGEETLAQIPDPNDFFGDNQRFGNCHSELGCLSVYFQDGWIYTHDKWPTGASILHSPPTDMTAREFYSVVEKKYLLQREQEKVEIETAALLGEIRSRISVENTQPSSAPELRVNGEESICVDPGSILRFVGEGYTPSEQIKVYMQRPSDDDAMSETTSDSTGRVGWAYRAPQGEGAYVLQLEDPQKGLSNPVTVLVGGCSAEEPPASEQDPTITGHSIDQTSALAGEVITFTYALHNPNAASINVTLGAYIRPVGSLANLIDDLSNVREVTLQPGQNPDVERSFQIPLDAMPGSYDVVWRISVANYVQSVDPGGLTIQASELPPTSAPEQDAVLTGRSISRTTVMAGETITFNYAVHNPNDTVMDVSLGAQIRRSGTSGWTDDPANDETTVANPGSNSVSRSFTVPVGSIADTYDVRWVLFKPGDEHDSAIDLGGLTVQAPAPPPTQDAELTGRSISRTTVTAGETITFNYAVHNPNATSMNVSLGAQIRRSGASGWTDDPANDKTIVANPGSNSVSRSFTVPVGSIADTYDVRWVLYEPGDEYDDAIDPGGLTVQAPAPPPTQDATLTGRSISRTTVTAGETITFNYAVHNPNATSMNVSLGAQIRRSGASGWTDDPANDKTIVANPGSNSVSRSFTVPGGSAAGTYNVRWVLYEPGDEYDDAIDPGGLTVQAPAPPPTQDATLTGRSISRTTVTAGETITFNYAVHNPNATSMDVSLGAQIRRSGASGWTDDPANDKTTVANPGSNSVSRSFTVPGGSAAGTYDVRWVLYEPGDEYDDAIDPGGLTVQAPAPTLRIDGGTYSRHPRGWTFEFAGSGYTPYSLITQHIRTPTGGSITLSVNSTSTGDIYWSFTSDSTTGTGSYDIWMRDPVRGESNHVTEVIDP